MGTYADAKFTGHVLVLSRSLNIRSVPSVGGSIWGKGDVFTANPTPCSLLTSRPFPCQRKVYSFFCSVPSFASLVSWRAAISTLSLAFEI